MEIIKIEKTKSDWSYFWIKTVKNIDLTKHCAKCLIGEYLDIKPQVISNNIAYICGVSKPFNYSKNLHIAIIYEEGSILTINEKNVNIVIQNARRVDINGLNKGEGLLPYGNKREYYTCRNWQFANQLNI